MRKAFPHLNYKRDIIGDILGTGDQADAATQAASIQAGASAEGIAEQRRQFDKIVELMAPFISTGTGALDQQKALIGLNGEPAQQTAIDNISNSPFMQELMQQGENGILQNASATGGLRGGNTQAALAKFRPNMLNALIDQQYSRLGGLSQMGQAGAAGQASAGMATGSNVANLLTQSGAAQAGGVIAAGNQQANTMGTLLKIGGTVAGFF
jgi:hypothetical protein